MTIRAYRSPQLLPGGELYIVLDEDLPAQVGPAYADENDVALSDLIILDAAAFMTRLEERDAVSSTLPRTVHLHLRSGNRLQRSQYHDIDDLMNIAKEAVSDRFDGMLDLTESGDVVLFYIQNKVFMFYWGLSDGVGDLERKMVITNIDDDL